MAASLAEVAAVIVLHQEKRRKKKEFDYAQ